jgi:5'-3' exonuclease
VLAKFGHIESIPVSAEEWHVNVLNSASLAATLARERKLALLFRTLATLRSDIPLFDNVDSLLWSGPRADFDAMDRLLDKAAIEKESRPKPGTSTVRETDRTRKPRKI